jgi:hypothetical protein
VDVAGEAERTRWREQEGAELARPFVVAPVADEDQIVAARGRRLRLEDVNVGRFVPGPDPA